MKITEAGLWYHKNWGINIVFTSSTRVPLHKWKEYFVRRQTTEELINIVNNLKRRPRAVAGVVHPDYFEKQNGENTKYVAVLDIEFTGKNVSEYMSELAKETPVVKTRRGWHVWFMCEKKLPFISFEGEFDLITKKHLVHLPPSLRLVGEDPVTGRKEYFIYEFHPACASNPRNPATLKIDLAVFSPQKIESIIKDVVGREFNLDSTKDLIVRKHAAATRQKDISHAIGHFGWIPDFQTFLELLQKARETEVGLPRCVEWAFFEKHGRGSRWIAGHIVVLATLHCVFDPSQVAEDLDKYLVEILEDYPEDDYTNLYEKLISRPYLRDENWLPAYSAPMVVPENLCAQCPENWFLLCRAGEVVCADLRRGLLGNTKKVLIYLPAMLFLVYQETR